MPVVGWTADDADALEVAEALPRAEAPDVALCEEPPAVDVAPHAASVTAASARADRREMSTPP